MDVRDVEKVKNIIMNGSLEEICDFIESNFHKINLMKSLYFMLKRLEKEMGVLDHLKKERDSCHAKLDELRKCLSVFKDLMDEAT